VPILSPSPPASPICPLGYRAAMIRLRAEATSTSYSLLLPPPLNLLSTDRREDKPEVTLPPQKRLGIALGLAYEVGESSSTVAARPARGLRADYGFIANIDREIRRDPKRDVGYGITDSWDEIVKTLQGAPVSTDTELGRHITAFETRVRQDTDEIYTRLDDEQCVTAALAARDANRNGDDSHTSGMGGRRTERIVRKCTYQDFMKCKPLYFKGTEGVADLRKKMTDKYCPRYEMKKLEAKLWNLKVKGTDVIWYNQRFQELALLCVRMFPEESDKIERYVGGLPNMIHGNIVACMDV
ncbi:reverse transcriptase domain-containing protein, partial [Tanacetum coccineum]